MMLGRRVYLREPVKLPLGACMLTLTPTVVMVWWSMAGLVVETMVAGEAILVPISYLIIRKFQGVRV